MLDLLIFNDSLQLTAYIALAFIAGGIVKGILGMGMPAILMVLLTFIMPPVDAIRLITLPMLFVNIVQYSRGPDPIKIAKGYWIFSAACAVMIILTASNIKSYPEEILLGTIGIAMVFFAVPSLFGLRFSVGPQRIWQALAGGIAGVLGGLSGVWSPPVVMYLMGRELNRDEFIGVSGFLYMMGCIALAGVLGTIDLLTIDVIVASVAGFFIALTGFRIGEMIRSHINREAFRQIFLIGFLILGMRLLLVSIL
jgi:uncharacterized membrane protein YfcA